jgi:hypothetical protein
MKLIVDGDSARDLKTAVIAPEDGKIFIRLQPYGGFSGTLE